MSRADLQELGAEFAKFGDEEFPRYEADLASGGAGQILAPRGPISFFVPGIPAPGGSKKAFAYKGGDGKQHVAVSDAAGKRNKNWRAVVALAAERHFSAPFAGPLRVKFIFAMPRPKSHYGEGRNVGKLKPGREYAFHMKKEDVLKLARSTEDALTGIAWRDDKQTVDLHVMKGYDERPGCLIEIEELA